jgi:hypothetical protein
MNDDAAVSFVLDQYAELHFDSWNNSPWVGV